MMNLLTSLSVLPHEFSVFVLSILPLVEMRLALPIALFVFHLPFIQAFVITFFGTLLTTGFLYTFFTPIFSWLKTHWTWLHRLIDLRLKTLERKHASAYHRFGGLFLFLFVAAPFPGTGIWTAIPLGILLGIKQSISIPAVLLGAIASALIATFLTQGVIFIT